MSNSYGQMAEFYDQLTTDVPYDRWAEYILSLFDRFGGKRPELLLELACGTGSLTYALAQKGIEMIGVDASPDMLQVAMEKCADISPRPLLLCQRMEELDLYGTVSGVVSSLDSINYLSDVSDLEQAFARVGLFLEPDGLFIFDVNTPYKLQRLHLQTFVRETEDCFCVWQAEYNEDKHLAHYDMDFFVPDETGRYRRFGEEHTERGHSLAELYAALRKAHMEPVAVLSELSAEPASDTEERVFIVARRTHDCPNRVAE